VRNKASANVFEGFRVLEESSPGSAGGNIFTQNMSRFNGGLGYRDASLGEGTAGTANTYTRNQCHGNASGGSDPTALC